MRGVAGVLVLPVAEARQLGRLGARDDVQQQATARQALVGRRHLRGQGGGEQARTEGHEELHVAGERHEHGGGEPGVLAGGAAGGEQPVEAEVVGGAGDLRQVGERRLAPVVVVARRHHVARIASGGQEPVDREHEGPRCAACSGDCRRGGSGSSDPIRARPRGALSSTIRCSGRIAQSARALPSHGRGHRFESCYAHPETAGQGPAGRSGGRPTPQKTRGKPAGSTGTGRHQRPSRRTNRDVRARRPRCPRTDVRSGRAPPTRSCGPPRSRSASGSRSAAIHNDTAVWRRSWMRTPSRQASRIAGRQNRLRQDPARRTPPSAPANTSAAGSSSTNSARCCSSAAATVLVIGTVRRPARVLGAPHSTLPRTSTALCATRTRRRRRSTAPRRRPASSLRRRPQ